MIIAVLGEKGGTGKTTLATNLAGMRAAANRDVLIIDADRQGSASYWTEKRDDLHSSLPTVHCVQKFGNGLLRTVRDMARRYDDIVLDIGAGDSREGESALQVADCAIIPVQPAGLDVWTLGLIDDRVQEVSTINKKLAAFGDCSGETGLPPTGVYRIVRVRTIEPGGPYDVRSRRVPP